MTDDLEALARSLLDAWDRASCIELPSARAGGLSTADAYAVAERVRALRVSRGEKPLGWKIGFTNRGIWERYGVFQPMWGPVWDTTAQLLDGTSTTLSLAGLNQPRLEPEVAFGFARDPRPGMTLDELRGCLAWVARTAPPLSWGASASPNLALDYILLLGALLAAADLAYVEGQFTPT